MDLISIFEAVGGSIFPDELRGDFRNLQDANEQCEQQDNDTSYAEQLLIRAVTRMMQGDLSAAQSLLDKISSLHGIHCRWFHRRDLYSAYLVYLRRFPPLIKFRPELGGNLTEDRNDTLRYRQTMETVELLCAATRQWTELIDSAERDLEVQIIRQSLGQTLLLWYYAFPQNPEFPRGQWIEKRLELNEELIKGIERLEELRNRADGYGLHKLSAEFELLILELQSGKSGRLELNAAEALRRRYERNGDSHGLAYLKMLEADRLLSPSFTNPIAMNLVPIDSDDARSTNLTWDSVEDSMMLRFRCEAQTLYDEALARVERQRSPRLHAAILLRQSCVAHAEGMRLDISLQDRHAHLSDAKEKLKTASILCSGDYAQTQIVRCHQMLVDLSTGGHVGARNLAREIGEWGSRSKNEGISYFLGALMLKFGRRLWIHGQHTDKALSCFRCAAECFQGLKDRMAKFQAKAFELDLLRENLDFGTARNLFEEQVPIFRDIISDLEKHAESSLSRRDYYLLQRKNFLTTFGGMVSNILRNSDVDRLRQWRDELDELKSHQGTVAAVNRALDNPYVQEHVLGGRTSESSILGGVISQVDADDELFDEYHKANSAYQDALQAADPRRAEEILRELISLTEQGSASSYTRYLTRIYALFQLGETEDAKLVLEHIADKELFDGKSDDVASSQSPWASSHYPRKLKNPECADNAIAICALAQEWKRGYCLLEKITDISPGYLDPAGPDRVQGIWSRFCWAAIVEEHSNRHLQAFLHYVTAAELAELLRGRTKDPDSRRSIFSALAISEIFAGLSRLCLFCHDANIPVSVIDRHQKLHLAQDSWQEHALLFQEQGTARALYDSLLADIPGSDVIALQLQGIKKRRLRAALKAIPPNKRTAEEIRELQELEEAQNGEEDDSDVLDALEERITGNLTHIPAKMLFDAIPDKGSALAVGFSRFGSTYFVANKQGVTYAEPVAVRDTDVRAIALDIIHHIHDFAHGLERQWTDHQTQLMQDLSDFLLAPMSSELKASDHILFAVSQPLNTFPFSALPYNGRPLCLSKAVSIIPSLSTLMHLAQKAPQNPVTPRVSVVSKSMSEADYREFKDPSDDFEEFLPMTGIEGMVIAHMFDTWPLRAKFVGRDRFLRALAESNFVVVGTHGYIDPRSPLFSWLSLKEGFRVIDLVMARSHAHVVVLAACLSGLGYTTASTDVMGFSHALLGTGTLVFLGCLWKVSDVATTLLLVSFFLQLSKSTGEETIAELWSQAQRALYDMDSEKAKGMIDLIVQRLERATNEGRDPERLVYKYKERLELLRATFGKDRGQGSATKATKNIDFKHPFYYAGLGLFGYGALRCGKQS